MEAALGSILGAGWASGINLYATVLLLGLLGRTGVAPTPESLQEPWVLAVAAVLYLLEFVVDKIPFVDTAWDTIHTVIRPVGAAFVGAAFAGEDVSTLLGGGVAGFTALGAHATKAGARVAINTSPEPVTNIGLSLLEDVTVVGMVWFAVMHPWVAGIAAIMLLALGTLMLVAAWRLIQRGLQRFRRWRAHRTAGAHLR